jgi:hypothetical protein
MAQSWTSIRAVGGRTEVTGVWHARAIAIDLRHFRWPHGVEPTGAGREMLGKAEAWS